MAADPARRRVAWAGAGIVLVAVVVIGIVQASHRNGAAGLGTVSPRQASAALAGSPAPLAALHAQAGQLVPGGQRTLGRRLAALRGYPVVVNKWASWCGPCRAEFGVLAHAAVQYGRSVAFLGLDSTDNDGDALRFLRSHPVSYPSVTDPGGGAGTSLTKSTNFPVTVFMDRARRTYIHQGPYTSVAALAQDVRRYALT